MTDVFKAYGVPEDEARICTDVLLESDRRGIESHGCNRFKPIYIDRFEKGTLLPVTNLEIVKETDCTIVMDAHDGMGMVASYRMMEKLIEKARAHGVAAGAIYNSTHYGIAGYWTSMAEKEGMVGIATTNARPSVAPLGGVEPMMGTNPMTFSMPTDEPFPFCFDCSSSTIQNGKIEYWMRNGKPTPEGVVISRDGEHLSDSAEVLRRIRAGEAALLPLGGTSMDTGGHKGYGWTAAIEILSAAFTGAPFMKALSGRDENGNPQMYHLGHFFLVIDPAAFMGVDVFRHTAGEINRELRASAKAPGVDRIFTPGEKEYEAWMDRKDKGVPVGETIQKELVYLRDKLGLTQYNFPFEK